MLSSTKKDKNYRICVKKFEIKKLQAQTFTQDLNLQSRLAFLRSLSDNNQDSEQSRRSLKDLTFYSFVEAKKSLSLIPRNSSQTRVRNRCIETGRARSVVKFCKLSRIRLREKASKGVISGISKASW